MKTKIISFVLVILLSACVRNEKDFDASGAFEATEIIVSAETMGQIVEFNAEEGASLTLGQTVLKIDSTQLSLKKSQLKASIAAIEARRPDIKKQISALDEQIATAEKEKSRITKLVQAEAINTKQLDDVNAQLSVLRKQKDAVLNTLNSTDKSVVNEIAAYKAQLMQIEDQLSKCSIVAPTNGVLLIKYAELGELAAPGKALFKVAELTKMRLKAYITGNQLASVKLGQVVNVFIDSDEESMKSYKGTISKIASQAEFTPKTIQTKDERANQVYAIQVDVVNDGFLKIGMYGEVKF